MIPNEKNYLDDTWRENYNLDLQITEILERNIMERNKCRDLREGLGRGRDNLAWWIELDW